MSKTKYFAIAAAAAIVSSGPMTGKAQPAAPKSPNMTFFVTSAGPGKGADLGGLEREHATLWGLFLLGYVPGSRDERELVPKMVWRVKLVAELEPDLATEVEVDARHAPGRRGGSRPGACEMALVARALAGMPAQTRGPVSLGAAQACMRRARYRTSPAARQ